LPNRGGGDIYVGWDWASQRHDVTVIDDTGQLVDRWTLAHTEAGIDQAMTRLAGHGRPDDLRVAIEATSGIVVDRLLAAGHPVVPIHPNSFNAARPRWGASKAKSDPGDSFKLADYLRTDGHRLRAAPVAVDQLDPEVLADCIRIQVRLLRSLLGSLADLDRALAAALGEHPKATVLQPLPRIGQINLAQVLAEVGPIPDRASDLSHAAAEVGATPVTKQSGKGAVVQFRWAANTRARNALGIFADNSRHAPPWAAHLYRQARRRGKRHPQAIRILMRAWLRVIWACWHTGRPYDINHHRAEQRLAQEPAA
jgi:Transposase/Transposase IS116/IS110/IS902 family